MRFALAFGLLGVVLAASARTAVEEAVGGRWPIAGVEAYLAACFLALATMYGLREAGVGVEGVARRPVVSAVVRAVVLPYLVLGAVTLFIARWFDREGLLNAVAPGLHVGRLPFPFERGRLRAAGVVAVLNLCWEFPRL